MRVCVRVCVRVRVCVCAGLGSGAKVLMVQASPTCK